MCSIDFEQMQNFKNNPMLNSEKNLKLNTIVDKDTDDDNLFTGLSSLFNVNNTNYKEKLNPKFEHQKIHGIRTYNIRDKLKAPICLNESDLINRPGYHSNKCSEYKDDDETLDKKLDIIVDMMKKSKATVVYSGAGLSTSSGLGDYASNKNEKSLIHTLNSSKTRDELSFKHKTKEASAKRLSLKPTLGHHALAAMEKKGYIHHWLQQNHDRLAQKAGFPQEKLNEIHGGWGDSRNPVVKMSGSLRKDMCKWMEDWEDKVEVCLTVGTSLCGMRSDSMAQESCDKFSDDKNGLIIIGLQKTAKDDSCGVRLWGLLDDILPKLAKKLDPKTIVPDASCKKKGDEWIMKYPMCCYHTPLRTDKSKM